MSADVEARIEQYQVIPEQSTFTIRAFAEGLLSSFGHDPLISVRDFSGIAEFAPGDLEAATVNLVINTNSLEVINEGLKEKDRNEIESTMRNEVLAVEKYPEIVFKSTTVSLSRIREGHYRASIIGDLTLHGVMQSNQWISAELRLTDDGLKAHGEFSIKQRDFKIKLVSAAGGMLKVKNEVKCNFDITTRKQSFSPGQ
jgi:polyisoprenoid-binding protein YceI